MSNLTKMIKFSELSRVGRPIFESLLFSEKYLAHTPKETIEEHLTLVLDYFLKIVEVNKAEEIIDGLLKKAILTEEIKILNYAKLLFFNSIAFHDHGKTNANFQIERMSNPDPYFKKQEGKLGYWHSLLGAYIYIVHHFNEIQNKFPNPKTQQVLCNLALLFSYPIIKHHSSKLKSILKDLKYSDYAEECKAYLSKFQIESNPVFEVKVFEKIEKLLADVFKNEFAVFSLIKLNFSLLTASDYYATHHFKSELKEMYDEWGVFNEDLNDRIKKNFSTLKGYNKSLLNKTDTYRKKSFSDLNNKISPDNLNHLRQKLGVEILDGIEEHLDENIFYIEAPTGGGKTNLSVVALVKLLEKIPGQITKVFYVFPFTTLITQTAISLRKTIGLTEKEMIELHSKAGFHSKKEEEKDGLYGNQKANFIDNLFVNYPFVLLSHIKFFDILKTNRKESNYVLHRLVNSVVIIDELQSYSPSEWDKVKYFISHYAESFNIRFILMSATLPKIHGIAVGSKIEFQPLIKDAQKNYLQNINFSKRVHFDFSLIKKYKNISYEQLEEVVFRESEKYAQFNSVNPNSVYTIVEFIFKKSATEFYNHIQDKSLFKGYTIFVLSGTILEPRRKYIINSLKDKKNRKKKILLITTQVVEAGVDIDMDLGFKNQSLLDSDEQLAGRINRNVNKPKCTLFLFKKDEPFRIYGNDMRYEFTRNLSSEQKEKILREKDFDQLYNLVTAKINKKNLKSFTEGFKDYKSYLKNYDFEKVNSEFKLIDNETESFFVPLDIPIRWEEYPKDPSFSTNEQGFLKRNKCLSSNEEKVIGSEVWNLYVQTIRTKDIGFVQKAINIKILQGIMSKFIFSTYSNPKMIESIESFCEYNENLESRKIYGFYCVDKKSLTNDSNSIYRIENGLNENKLSESFLII